MPESLTLGKLYITRAKGRTYLCHKSEATGMKNRFVCEATVAKAGELHESLIVQIRDKIIAEDLSKEAAKAAFAVMLEELAA